MKNKETLEKVIPMTELVVFLDKIKKNLTNKTEVLTIQLIIDTIKNEFVDKEIKWQQEQDKNKYSEEDMKIAKENEKENQKHIGQITEKGIIDTIGNCANCGVEFHIHKDVTQKQQQGYSDEEVENILIEYVKTNPTKPYRVISWFTEFKNK